MRWVLTGGVIGEAVMASGIGGIVIEVPDGWMLNEPGDVLEVVPPDGSGAIHVSVYDRERPEPPSTEEAAGLLNWFQRRRGADAAVEQFKDGNGVPAARCAFSVNQDGEFMTWVAMSKIWPDVAVLATYVHDPEVEEWADAVAAAMSSIGRSVVNGCMKQSRRRKTRP